jgi:hypothetical protein
MLMIRGDVLANAGSVVTIIHIEKEPSRNATILLLEGLIRLIFVAASTAVPWDPRATKLLFDTFGLRQKSRR